MDDHGREREAIVAISDAPDMDVLGPLIVQMLGVIEVPEGHEALAPECNVHEPCWGTAKYVDEERAYCERAAVFALGRHLMVGSTISEANFAPQVEAAAFWEQVDEPLLTSTP